jgi:subfamily B ATP-binding cassette protein MsbA
MNNSSSSRRNKYFRRFLAYTLDYKGLLVLSIVMGCLKFGVNFAFPWLVGTAIDRVIRPADGVPTDYRFHWLWILVGLGVVISIVHAIATFGRSYYTAKLGNRIIADIRQDLFDHLHRLSLHFYSKERTGSIVSRLISDIQQASQIVNGGLVTMAMDMFTTVFGIFLLIGISWKLTLATMAVIPLYALTFGRLNPRVKEASRRVQSQISKISGNVQERMAGISVIKTYAAEERESERFHEDTEEHFDRVVAQSELSSAVSAYSEGLVHLGQTIVIGLGGYLAISHGLTPGQVVKFLGYLAAIYTPVRRFAEVNVIYQTSLAAIERVFEVFDITPKIVEKPVAVAMSPKLGEVVFENVTFDYSDDSDESRVSLEENVMLALESAQQKHDQLARQLRRRPVLNDICFTVTPGERVALVGPSGSGKTTLVSLLPRLYDVTKGRILIDGVDLREYRLRPLRRAIGIVQQDSFLFSGSVHENISYGRPDAKDEEIIDAAKAANAHDFIMALPEQYDTRLGERGVNLSGGQRQRVSIARALLKDPRILILDEATSALDSESEALVQEALSRLMVSRTCFIIAHRLSTIRDADRIFVMENGHIIEHGCHEELVQRGNLYARLVRQQFGMDPVLRAG